MKKRILVLHAQIPFTSGGAEHTMSDLTEQLNLKGYEAELVQLPYQWKPCGRIIESALTWRTLDLTEVNGRKIDRVIACKFPTYVVRHPDKVLWLMHQQRTAYDLYQSKEYYGLAHQFEGEKARETILRIDNQSFKECKKIYTFSQNVANRLRRYNHRQSDGVLYHPPALVGKYYCEGYEDYILAVGRLDILKRIDLLIRGIAYSNFNVHLHIAGSGPDEARLRSIVTSLKIENRVRFLGRISDDELLKEYANALAVYYAPVDEDMGCVTLEACLSKKPVITCLDSGGVLEFIRNEINGFICPSKEEEIAGKIDILFHDKLKASAMGEKGHEMVKAYTWDPIIDALTEGL